MASSPAKNRKKRSAKRKKREKPALPSDNPPTPKPVESGGSGSNPKRSTGLRYAWIIASLAALGIVLSILSLPQGVSSILSLPQGSSSSPPQQIPERPQPEEVSEEVLLDCGSLTPGVEYIVGAGFSDLGNQTLEEESSENATFTLTEKEQLASVSLVGELCNRPDLVRNMSSAYDPTIMLVAYGCDATLGKIGDAALQDSLSPFRENYCDPARRLIALEVNSLIEDAQSFITEEIPELREEIALRNLFEEQLSVGNSTTLLQNAESVANQTIAKSEEAQSSLSSGETYEAASLLDEAQTMFSAMIQEEEMLTLLGLEDEEELSLEEDETSPEE